MYIVCGYVSHFDCEELASIYCTISETSDSFAASRDIGLSSFNNTGSIKSEPNIHSKLVPIRSASESHPAIGMDDKNKTKKQRNDSSKEQQNNKNLSARLKRSSSVDSITDYSSNSSNQTKPL